MKSASADQAGLVAGLIACVALAILAIDHASFAAQGWLSGYLFWIGFPIGALFLALAQSLIGGDWGDALQPALDGMLITLPLLGLFLLPILVGLPHVYRWAEGGPAGWLNPWFFSARAIIYVLVWNIVGLLARRTRSLSRPVAWGGLILLFGTSSLAAFDWAMSLESPWTSTIFGLMVTSGWAISALAGAIAFALVIPPPAATPPVDAAARLLLALIVLWGYLSTVQLVVIWELNLPDEIGFYLGRATGGWGVVAALLAILEFVLPFLILVAPWLRRRRATLLLACLSVLCGHLLETWWLTVPDYGRSFAWADPVAVLAIGGLLAFVVARTWRARRPLRAEAGS